MTRRAHRSHAFLLVELMMAVGLLAVAALLAAHAFLAMSRTTAEIDQQHTASSAFDQAAAQLRRDVWTATDLTLQDPAHLNIRGPDGQTIVWRIDQSFQRTADSHVRHWNDLRTHFKFALRGPMVILSQEPTSADNGGIIVLPSQAMLLKGASR